MIFVVVVVDVEVAFNPLVLISFHFFFLSLRLPSFFLISHVSPLLFYSPFLSLVAFPSPFFLLYTLFLLSLSPSLPP